MAAPQWVTLRSQWLGQQLRELREANGLKIKEVAEYLQRDPGTVSRFESGFYPIRRPDLMALLGLYGISDRKRRDALMTLSEDVWQKGWWDGYAGDVAGTWSTTSGWSPAPRRSSPSPPTSFRVCSRHPSTPGR